MSAFPLSKPFIDVGLFTNSIEEMAGFTSEVLGLAPLDTVPIEPGYVLHRYDANGSALKLNALNEPLPARRTCYGHMVWPDPGRTRVETLVDPDGNEVERVPVGHLGIDQLGIVYRVSSVEIGQAFARSALGAREIGQARYRFGDTVLLFEVDADIERAGALESLGFTYTTLHVTDTAGAHRHLIANGCTEAIAPTPFESITTYSFVRDPMGGWIEISQRADLGGGAPAAVPQSSNLSQDDVRAIRRRA